ncbi:natural killer cell receptor 2B4 isoform X2 [Danio aesculapii]|uniref:natural killer cell receptor 2B4 isoform X2 n=1 Tax=Danio aesculapii TaxID=1142201 RepID=UPI0024BF4F66|nr:natural killer cell receptor 2B4 isoform X2 [Danio aesculapii]
MELHAFFCFGLWLLCGVLVVQSDEREKIPVMEGDYVTLNSNVRNIKSKDLILWTFRLKNNETRIAEIYKQRNYTYDDGINERFRHRLHLDEQTGSLTITNINKLHSGLYRVQIINGGVREKTFSIDVYDLQNPPSSGSSSQYCSVVCSVLNASAVSLSWYKGNSLLSSISASDLSISLSLPLEVEYQDKNTYSCVVNNPITNHTTHLDISQTCQTSSESRTSLLLLVVLLPLLFLITVTVVIILRRHRNYTQVKQKAQTNEDDIDYTEATFTPHGDQDTKAEGQDQTVYSEVFLKC